MVKVVVFDIGETLVKYNKPLNWSKMYRSALERMVEENNMNFSESDYEKSIEILTRYNTRLNPREIEFSSNKIFSEILTASNQNMNQIERCKNSFYSYFRNDAQLFYEVETVLKELEKRDIIMGTLSDVPYGMDNKYVLEDIKEIIDNFQYPYTSNDIGYRKPSDKGLKLIASKADVNITDVLYIGDEEKDILCAKKAGAVAVLINRSSKEKDYGQDYTISTLNGLMDII